MVKHHSGAYRARRKEKLITLARAIQEKTGEQLVPINFDQRNELFPDHWDKDGNRLMEVNALFAALSPSTRRPQPITPPPLASIVIFATTHSPSFADAFLNSSAPLPRSAKCGRTLGSDHYLSPTRPVSPTPPPAPYPSLTTLSILLRQLVPTAAATTDGDDTDVEEEECPICVEQMRDNDKEHAPASRFRCGNVACV